jgi:serine/threonine protein kinase
LISKVEQLTERVVLSFLRLYRIQMGVAAEQASFRLISSSTPEDPSASIYQLQVRTTSGVVTRRMSIAPFGEGIHSKSQCFKVIYDDRLVVKIPPTPIVDFKEYLNLMAIEKQIAEKLAPEIFCIIPGLSVILDKIPEINIDQVLAPPRREAVWNRHLQKHRDLQKFLKIGSSFALFSALADNRFLNEIIADIHSSERELPCEIQDSLGSLWNHGEIHSLYNEKTIAAIFKVDKLFRKFERQIPYLTKSLRLSHPLDAHWRQTIFIKLILGVDLNQDSSPIHPDLVDGVYHIWNPIAADSSKVISEFKACLLERIEANTYRRCQTYMASLSHQVLMLLERLKIQRVAIRDLKPDNIFTLKVSNLPEGVYSAPAVDALGLIDLETAVFLESQHGQNLRQPLLSGSPAYATPANLFENEILNTIHPDLARIFRLQDWYAAMGVIYKIITGKVLFRRTGGILPKILQLRNSVSQSTAEVCSAYRQASKIFWRSAVNEFELRAGHIKDVLNFVDVPVTREIRKSIKKALDEEASVAYQSEMNASAVLKNRQGHYKKLNSKFMGTELSIPGYQLLEMMLATVYSAMYPHQWETGSSPEIWRT